MRVHIIQQDEWVEPGEISAWIERHGYEVSYTRCWKYEKVLETVDADFLIIHGGWQSPQTTPEHSGDYYDAAAEKHLIQQYVSAEILGLRVCHGAQLLGEVLGAPYSHSPEKEIGHCFARILFDELLDFARGHVLASAANYSIKNVRMLPFQDTILWHTA